MLFLTPDAFGGRGGIALYSKHLALSLAKIERLRQIVLIVRECVDDPAGIPPKVIFRVRRSVLGFVTSALLSAMRTKFDVILCGHINFLPLGYIVKKVRGGKLVLLLHGIEAWKPRAREFLLKKSIPGVDVVISVSNVTLSRFKSWAPLRASVTHVLPNAVEIERFAVGATNERRSLEPRIDGSPVLLTLGRLDSFERAKGFDEVLECLPELIVRYPRLRYVIAGEGSDRERLERKAKTLGIHNHVVFLGYVPEDIKPDVYRSADVFVMPSRGEGFGFVFLEAMACGVPVIASTVDGSYEAVRQGRLGEVVDPTDRKALVDAIERCLRKKKGVPPEGLEFYSLSSFEARCARIFEPICSECD